MGESVNWIKKGAIPISEENVRNIGRIFYIMYLIYALLINTFYFKKRIHILILDTHCLVLKIPSAHR